MTENLKDIVRDVMKERRLSFVEECFKDPIKARNTGYVLGFLVIVMMVFIVYAGVQQLEMSFNVQDLARDNQKLIEKNERLIDYQDTLSKSNTKKTDIIYDLIEKIPCDGLKDLLLNTDYDSYDWNIQKYTIAKCV